MYIGQWWVKSQGPDEVSRMTGESRAHLGNFPPAWCNLRAWDTTTIRL